MMRVPEDSVLVGKTLADSRLVSAAGMIVIALERRNKVDALPSRTTVLQGGDRLLVQGRLERFEELRHWSELVIEREAPVLQGLVSEQVRLVEVAVAENSSLVKDLLHHTDFRRRFNANVLAIRRRDLVRRVNLAYVPLRAGDHLLLQGGEEALAALQATREFSEIREVTEEDLRNTYRMQERLFVVRVPRDSRLGGETLGRSRLGDAFDFRLLATFREGVLRIMPPPEEVILGGDLLLIQGRPGGPRRAARPAGAAGRAPGVAESQHLRVRPPRHAGGDACAAVAARGQDRGGDEFPRSLRAGARGRVAFGQGDAHATSKSSPCNSATRCSWSGRARSSRSSMTTRTCWC